MKQTSLAFCCLVLSLGLTSLAVPGYCQAGGEKIKVIIDTDIAEDIDDFLVTIFALNSQEFEVLAITTVDGDVEARSRVTRRLTKTFGRPEVPVASGYVWSMPLADTPIPEGMYGVTQESWLLRRRACRLGAS